MEVEINIRRLLSIWWLIVWRGVVLGFLLGAVVGAVVGAITGMIMAMTIHPLDLAQVQQTARATSLVVCVPLGIAWYAVVIRMALRKRYKDFRIALVSLDSAEAF
jgi:tetrahydromethanopterin S-methyltransferase subunit C